MHKDMTSKYYVVSFTTFRVHFGEDLVEYYALHYYPKEPVEQFGIN